MKHFLLGTIAGAAILVLLTWAVLEVIVRDDGQCCIHFETGDGDL